MNTNPPLSAEERAVFRRLREELRARALWRRSMKRRVELVATFICATVDTFGYLDRMAPADARTLADEVRLGHRCAREMLAQLGLIDPARAWPPPAPGEADPDLRAFTERPQ